MLDLTFGEQVKIVLGRKNMTIKELAEEIEKRTGKKMSRQNLTQRLGRDNFQEQDMRMIAGILGCPFRLDILGAGDFEEPAKPEDGSVEQRREQGQNPELERDITIGELVDIHQELDEMMAPEEEPEPEAPAVPVEELLEEMEQIEREERELSRERERRGERAEEHASHGWKSYLHRKKRTEEETEESAKQERGNELLRAAEAVEAELDQAIAEEAELDQAIAEEAAMEKEASMAKEAGMEQEAIEAQEPDEEEDLVAGDVNPYTGREYQTNSVRMHPKRIGYVQVYDRGEHKWTDMTEWAFLGYQERKKALLGKDYEPPIYLD